MTAQTLGFKQETFLGVYI